MEGRSLKYVMSTCQLLMSRQKKKSSKVKTLKCLSVLSLARLYLVSWEDFVLFLVELKSRYFQFNGSRKCGVLTYLTKQAKAH